MISLSQKEKNFNKKYEDDLVEARRKLNEDLLSIEMSALAFKDDFVTFIKDKSISIDTRWNLFKQAARAIKDGTYDLLKNESNSIDYLVNMIDMQDSKEEYLNFYTVNLIGIFFNWKKSKKIMIMNFLHFIMMLLKLFCKQIVLHYSWLDNI